MIFDVFGIFFPQFLFEMWETGVPENPYFPCQFLIPGPAALPGLAATTQIPF